MHVLHSSLYTLNVIELAILGHDVIVNMLLACRNEEPSCEHYDDGTVSPVPPLLPPPYLHHDRVVLHVWR